MICENCKQKKDGYPYNSISNMINDDIIKNNIMCTKCSKEHINKNNIKFDYNLDINPNSTQLNLVIENKTDKSLYFNLRNRSFDVLLTNENIKKFKKYKYIRYLYLNQTKTEFQHTSTRKINTHDKFSKKLINYILKKRNIDFYMYSKYIGNINDKNNIYVENKTTESIEILNIDTNTLNTKDLNMLLEINIHDTENLSLKFNNIFNAEEYIKNL